MVVVIDPFERTAPVPNVCNPSQMAAYDPLSPEKCPGKKDLIVPVNK